MKHLTFLLLLIVHLFANIPTYDKVGNLVTKTIDGIDTDYTYNANDQLISKGSITYTYDANGNLISDGTHAYSYDEQNRLIKVETPDKTIEYSYDAEGNRIAKMVNGETTTYLVDTNTPFAQVITESRADGTTVEYTYGNDLLSDGTHNFLIDALGSTRGLVDSSETLTDSYAYTPYGELISHSGNSENSFLFTGEQFDSETGNYYLRARYCSPALTCFLSRDTYEGKLIDPLSQNRYAYAQGNPVLYVDPSGHMTMIGLIEGMNLRVMAAVARIQTSFITVGSAGSAFVYLGKIVERQAGTIIQVASRMLQYRIAMQRGVVQFGPGGKRVIDLLVRGKDAIARIEVKYQLPTQAGSALNRLVGQMQTSVSNSGQTVLFSFKEPEIRTLIRVVDELEKAGVPARSIQFVHGYRGLAQWFALYFHP